jgi:hypothetical protein
MASPLDNLNHIEKDAGTIQVENFDTSQGTTHNLTPDEKKLLKQATYTQLTFPRI